MRPRGVLAISTLSAFAVPPTTSWAAHLTMFSAYQRAAPDQPPVSRQVSTGRNLAIILMAFMRRRAVSALVDATENARRKPVVDQPVPGPAS
jgi:hypothetical protein